MLNLISQKILDIDPHWKLECVKEQFKCLRIKRVSCDCGHQNPTMKHNGIPLMQKSLLKINNFEGLEKVCHKFSQTFLWKRHDTPHQTSTENDPQNIVTHRTWQSTIRHTHRHSPYLTKATKGQIPTLNLPPFSKHSSNIYLFPDFLSMNHLKCYI